MTLQKKMPQYDVIGDVHGYVGELEALLEHMGYTRVNGVYQHPERKVVFLGDYIDRGPGQKKTINIVRSMIEGGHAHGITGNHEFNAICYALKGDDDQYVRSHGGHNSKQHQQFLEEYPFGSPEHEEILNWFKTLPVFLELDGAQFVHACWREESLKAIQPFLDDSNCLTEDAYQAFARKEDPAYSAIKTLVIGPKHKLPDNTFFLDPKGIKRTSSRIKWWIDSGAAPSNRLMFEGHEHNSEELALINQEPISMHFNGISKPTFFGHYWLTGRPTLLSGNVACLDYSVVMGNPLVAYRWDGEQTLSEDKFAYARPEFH